VAASAPPFGLSATASSGLPVTYVITSGPATVAGSVLTVTGSGIITVTASQAGNVNYSAAAPVSRTFSASALTTTITWNPGPLAYGTPLGAAQLNATASVPGTFTYFPAAGSILPAGLAVLSVSFTPFSSLYTSSSQSVYITVSPGPQTITFPPIGDQLTSTPPITLGATSTSGLAITYSIVSGPATVSGNVLTITGKGAITVQASQAGNTNYLPAAPVTATFNTTIGPVKINSVLNAASYAAGKLTPGSYAVVFGLGFSGGGTDRPTITLTDVSGTETPVSAYFVSPTQLNILVPAGTAIGTATLKIVNTESLSATFQVTIASVAPALFTADSSGKGAPAGYALVLSSDNSSLSYNLASCGGTPVACTPVPVLIGTGENRIFLTLYGTGFRNAPAGSVTATIGGTAATVQFAGAQPSYPGLDQVNIQVPSSLRGAGKVTLQLTVNGIAANPVTVAFQ